MIAVYARQSVEKEGSISIATQLELCRVRAGEDIAAFYDEGYTGANTDRPGFQSLMQAVERGEIDRVIVYKLDRISRSLTDFARIIEVFEKYNVKFTSLNEDFDTTNAMGKAMLGVVMIFAQLERETTQKRVKDAFYARMRQGFYVSGVAPIGFVKVPHSIGGIRTRKLAPDPVLVPLIEYLYTAYEEPLASIGSLVREVSADYEKWGLEKPLSGVRIRRILRNPVYVRADAQVYRYLSDKGAQMVDDAEEFDGTRGCSVYGERGAKTTAKFTDLTGEYVKLGWHEGLIPAPQWLAVQHKLDGNRQLRNAGRGTHSWLSGLVKCGYCGYALTVVNGQRNGRQYINCGGRKQKLCYERKSHTTFAQLEETVGQALRRYWKGYRFTQISRQRKQEQELHRLSVELQKCEQEERALNHKLLSAEGADLTEVMQVLNTSLSALHREQKQLRHQIARLSAASADTEGEAQIRQYLAAWETLPLEEKKAAARLFLREVRVTDERVEIVFLTEELPGEDDGNR